MNTSWIWQSLIWLAGMAALLLVPAGTWHWPAAWVLMATMVVISLATGSWLARTDPELLAERMRVTAQREQPVADKFFMLAIAVIMPAWLILIGLEHRRHGTELPLAL